MIVTVFSSELSPGLARALSLDLFTKPANKKEVFGHK
jgi:hypothetical protein